MIIKLLDTKTLGYDLTFERFKEFGDVEIFDFTQDDELIARCLDADILISNKIQYNKEVLQILPKLKLICLTSTGTNTVDLLAAKENSIVVKNIVHYSTASVVQLTYAMLFKLMTPLNYYDHYVKSGRYIDDYSFGHYEVNWHELSGKTLGIVGMGHIGQSVAKVAEAFGARVIYYSTSGENHNKLYEEVVFDDLLKQSDIISIHAPLTPKTMHLFTRESFKKMKKSSYLLNLGRGAIVDEEALIDALNQQDIAAAGIDVLAIEPMTSNHCIYNLEESNRLIMTPHIGWASIESRQRMLDEVYKNIKAYLQGDNYQTVV